VNGWLRVRLDDCCRIVAGATPSTSVDEYWNGEICWATPKDLSDLPGPYLDDTPRKITKAGLENCAAEILPTNSVLFSSRAPIGHVAINRIPTATNQGFKSFIPDPSKLSAEFLFHWLRANRSYLENLGNGATFKEVSKATVSRIEIDLPPLDEQRRIAEVLNQAQALCATRVSAIEKLDLLVRSIFNDLFGDPIRNSKALPTIPLGEIARFVGGGTPSRAVSEYFQGAICWATSKDMKGELLSDTQEHITERAIEESATNLVHPETILVVVKSKILMHRLPVLIAKVPTCFGQDLKGIILKQPWTSRYIARHLRLGQKWLLDRARGANTEGLTLDHLREYPVRVPPAALAERYEQIEQTIESQRERMKKSLAKLDLLFASLQHRAFRGEL
jgi:type I restriction enzyme S subunit